MLSREEYIRLSLELNLFFLRIAKEHSIFLESGFTGKDANFAQEADNFKVKFEELLADTIALSNGVISPETAMSEELITPFTLRAEQVSSFLTGIPINTNLTQAEAGIISNFNIKVDSKLERKVFSLNQRAIVLTSSLIQFKSTILKNVLSCKLFTTNYPLLIEHILREARFYLKMLTKLQNGREILNKRDLIEQEVFWNRIMAEHSKFIRGLLDPTEEELINTANNFSNEFDKLTKDAIAALNQTMGISKVTNDSLQATKRLRDFKATGTEGLIKCNIKAIAYPLLADHVLREANHYLRILNQLGKK
ncbi:MAG TPA: DUF2935 domain-containing protein [Clostridiaceae bacterium]|nr:DUF2935 domain-containing protein [Clostridiaceae bacterium]